NAAVAGQVERLMAVRATIASWYHQAGSMAYGQWKLKNNALTQEKETLERELARAVSPGGRLRDILSGYSLLQFCSLLKGNEALVDVYRYELIGQGNTDGQHYAAVILSSSGPVAVVDLGAVAIVDEAAYSWRQQVVVGNEASANWRNLCQLLWNNLSVALPQEVSQLWVSPDAELTRIPWHLCAETSPATSKLLVAQLDSARELAYLRLGRSAGMPQHPVFLLAGGIDFGSSSDAAGDRLEVPPLPGTLDEVKVLEKLAQKQEMSVTLLTGREATKARVLTLLPKASWVHFATHGFFFDEATVFQAGRRAVLVKARESLMESKETRNPLVESGLVLAGGSGNGGQGMSGRLLTAEELVGLNLMNCESMTLSACETGLGKEVTGQGVMGLRASIMAAGAKSVLISLWKIPDESTLKLMELFYTNLWVKKLPKAEALHQAQVAVRDTPYERFKAPVYWAGWVLVGDAW
ncbi:MAG: CHAT domain-containing protein, partial [Candidatus Melainabacteria bacterium]|nr:CHAT domain-containing protein [Candidatus Melainabacteria bacterium]